ncbi:uncharacterized protein LOC123397789 [Hordeum vulgare subsp. vulgare]|uniref:uncharacterized protein LOC123397789 n=1 Tax=Hordeum vulgare subsp. vulgare TaxID=112509 RepID=UPI00162E686F|nr:uncharacterized protein LOC123397789 [Hordeum vulgare subsp. vulgare]
MKIEWLSPMRAARSRSDALVTSPAVIGYNIRGGFEAPVDSVFTRRSRYCDSDEEFFTHTCGPAPNTGHGVPVLDVDSRLVGFSDFNMQGPTKSLPRITFEKELNKIVNSKDLKHFKHLIYMAGWNMVRDVRTSSILSTSSIWLVGT